MTTVYIANVINQPPEVFTTRELAQESFRYSYHKVEGVALTFEGDLVRLRNPDGGFIFIGSIVPHTLHDNVQHL